MDTPASYINVGFITISVPNLALIAGMILLFVLALVAPFLQSGSRPPTEPTAIVTPTPGAGE